MHTLEGHSAWLRGAAVSPDGRRAVSASFDHTLRYGIGDAGSRFRHQRALRSELSANGLPLVNFRCSPGCLPRQPKLVARLLCVHPNYLYRLMRNLGMR